MWLLCDSIARKIDEARAKGLQLSDDVTASLNAQSAKSGKITKAGKVAQISVDGVLTEKPDLIAAWFGGGNTTYPDIAKSISEANQSKDVDAIELLINSPGGSVSGLFSAMDSIKGSEKAVTSIVGSMATSAAYGLASQATSVYVRDRGSMLGSAGVAFDTFVFDGEIKEISIASTDAPNKRPDLLSDDGQAVVRKELDDIHGLFVESIAKGRNTTVKDINKNYGRGGIVLAREALEVGMIDGIIGDSVQSDTQQTANGGKQEVRSMDLKTLQTEHPDVYAEAVEIGAKEERERVNAHLKMGEACGDMEIAHNAIKAGDGMGPALMAEYGAATIRHTAIQNREEDNSDAGKPKTEIDAADDFDKAIIAAMDARKGDGLMLNDYLEGGN